MAAARAAFSEGREVDPWIEKCERVLKYHRQWSNGHPVGRAQELLYRAKVYALRAMRFRRICVQATQRRRLTLGWDPMPRALGAGSEGRSATRMRQSS